ncbi:MAG TPA: HEAT repeat domain-containing protein [Kofleriaceae bacterium]
MIRLRVALGLLLLTGTARADKFNWEGQVEVDAHDLDATDDKKRVDAVRLLAMDDIHLSQRFLLKALGDKDLTVRSEAAKALGLGAAVAAVAPMIEWLSDPDPRVRGTAAEVLGDIGGPDATQALTRSLGDADPAVRQRAVKALGKIGLRGNTGVVVALIPRLEDDKSDVRRETVDQLEQLGDRRAVIPLVSRFNDTSRDVVKSAVRAVGKLCDKSAVPALIRLMSDTDENVRTAAVGSLGQLGAVEAIDALTEQLGSNVGDDFHKKIAFSLGQIAATPGAGKAGEDAMRVLVENLAYNTTTRSASMEALRVAGKASVPALVAHLTGRIKGDPTSAVKMLAETGDSRATVALTAELERGRVAMPLVLKALGATHDPNALVPVLGAVANKDAAIRIAAMEALRPLLGSDARAGDVLIERLGDDDIEVRILAAEYLGTLRVTAATTKLTALAGPGNPTRLRLASIDALGEIGTVKPNPQASALLVGVLREGPTELHLSAAAALSHIADPSALPALISLAETDRGPTRHEVVRALGGTLRGHPDPGGRKVLRMLAQDANVKVAVAAIAGLAAADDPGDAEFLRKLVTDAAADRRRSAAWALGEIHDTASIGVLTDVLGIHDDRLVGDAAWALGEIAVAAPQKVDAPKLFERFVFLANRGGWAAAIDGSAALARTLWAVPLSQRTALRPALVKLAFHKSRLVRINVALALSSLTGDDEAAKALAQLLHDDPSPHVRSAAADGLARLAAGTPKPAITAALEAAAKSEPDADVRASAQAALVKAPPAVSRSEWRNLYVVDVGADDARVRQEPFFVHGEDGVVWASYTDARGELTSEHVPPAVGAPNVWSASREPEY